MKLIPVNEAVKGAKKPPPLKAKSKTTKDIKVGDTSDDDSGDDGTYTIKADNKKVSSTKAHLTQRSTVRSDGILQTYNVDLDKELSGVRSKQQDVISAAEKKLGKPFSDFSKNDKKYVQNELKKNVLIDAVKGDPEYVKSGVLAATEPVHKGSFSLTVGLPEEGTSVTIHSPTSRKRGQTDDPETKQATIPVYTHTDSEGNTFTETSFEHHKRIKDGGATEEEVHGLSMSLLKMARDIKAPFPDAIVIPPITKMDPSKMSDAEKKKIADTRAEKEANATTDEDIQELMDEDELANETPEQKVQRSINHRVSQHIANKITMSRDPSTDRTLTGSEVAKKILDGKEQDLEHRTIAYDPLALGTKDFQVKQFTGRDADGKMQQSKEWRARETLRRMRDLPSMQPDVLKEKFKDVKHVWLLDDNVDKGGTLFAIAKIFEGIGISTTTMSLYDMRGRQFKERENKEALAAKSRQGRLQFKARQENQ